MAVRRPALFVGSRQLVVLRYAASVLNSQRVRQYWICETDTCTSSQQMSHPASHMNDSVHSASMYFAAMSLAAEDEEELLRIPAHSSENPYGSRRPRQPYASRPRGSGLRFEESLTDPFAVLHPTRLLRNSHSASHIDSDAAYAMMAALMSDFDEPNGASHIGAGTGDPVCHCILCLCDALTSDAN